ncbi:hypothetical protein OHB36_06555 [Streptomyces sp. NBC_00320]|uniref:hypothetical protein n=1 Tax=unclassified Streptomyces TaxID=2593676 RepID=UPI0022568AEE|nr:hypothetical protein [Streptomyces sp. NBC_00320]MCX5146454.1 hypothetical protein [Streptomyces sp. NBC_00320]
MQLHTRLNTRRAVASLFAGSLVLSGAIVLAPTASAAPAASCTVTPGPNNTYVTISGEGFTAPRTLNDGESTVPLAVDGSGHFLVKRFQKNVNYTVLAVNEDQPFVFVNCKVVKGSNTQSPTPTTTPSPTRTPRHHRR